MWEGVRLCEGEEAEEEKEKEKKTNAGVCKFGIPLEKIAHSGEMDFVPRLNSVLTLVLSG